MGIFISGKAACIKGLFTGIITIYIYYIIMLHMFNDILDECYFITYCNIWILKYHVI
jgi:hypothetical protein